MGKRGFTLIELLVVISIVALLSSVVLSSLDAARAKARDAKRLSDIRQIQLALEQYYADNGRYPTSQNGVCAPATVPNNSWCNSIQSLNNGRWIAGGALAPYLPYDPVDPKPHSSPQFSSVDNAAGGSYFYFSYDQPSNGCDTGQSYMFVAGMESASNRKNTFRGCNGSTYTSGGTYIVGESVP